MGGGHHPLWVDILSSGGGRVTLPMGGVSLWVGSLSPHVWEGASLSGLGTLELSSWAIVDNVINEAITVY